MRFFQSLYNSLYNFQWLRNQKNNTSWAWSYFFLLLFLVSGLLTISLGFKYWSEIPKMREFINNELPDFQAQVKDGSLKVTGVQQPYIKSYDSFLVAVDTVSTSSAEVVNFLQKDTQSAILITQDKIQLYDADSKQVKTELIKNFSDYSADRASVVSSADKFLSNQTTLFLISIIFLMLMLFLGVGNLLNILLVCLIFYFFAKKRTLPVWKFKDLFNVGLFAITLPLILSQTWSGMVLNWLAILIFVIWMYLVVFRKDTIIKR